MFQKINKVLRITILIVGAGVLLARLMQKDPYERVEEQVTEKSRREENTFQQKEFDFDDVDDV